MWALDFHEDFGFLKILTELYIYIERERERARESESELISKVLLVSDGCM